MGIGIYAPGNNVLVFPADLVAQSADGAVLAAGTETEDTESLGNNHTLLLVVRGRDTLENLEALKSSSTTGGLVGHHSTDGLVEDAGRSTEVEGTCEVQYGWFVQTISSYSGIGVVSPPRVGLKRVILRR
jgi:hypothetical protein